VLRLQPTLVFSHLIRLCLLALACTALGAPLQAQVEGQESFPAPEARASAAELAARDAYMLVRPSVDPPADRSRRAFDAYLKRLAEAFATFAKKHEGTAAAMEAQHELALMEIHALKQVDRGLARMAELLKARDAWNGTAPEGLRLDLDRYEFVYALALADLDRHETAEAVLTPLAAKKDSDGEQARELLKRIHARKLLRIGQPLPDFAGKRFAGEGNWSKSDFTGKVVLIQFWATWCRPCAQEMPQLAEYRTEFAERGFEVLGVSLDDDRREGRPRMQAFLKAAGLAEAPQIYDGLAWQTSLVKQFAIRAIPANFLVDQQGIIRARNLRGEELRKAIGELLPASKDGDEESM